MRAWIVAIFMASACLSLGVVAETARISASDLMAWLDSDDPPLVLDTRGRDAYRAGSLPGAINAGRNPLGYLPDNSREPVVLILPKAADATFVEGWRRRLADAGHPVLLLEGGLEGWRAVGGPIEQPGATYADPSRVPFLIPRGLCEGNEPAHIFR